MEILPYKHDDQDKKQQVTRMFNKISGKYDLLNHLLSFNVDKFWRRVAVNQIKAACTLTILDVATGTADLAIASLKLNPEKVVGIDISELMIQSGMKKISKRNLLGKVKLMVADAENLPFANESFDVVMSGFGVRNFGNLRKGISEANRVLKNGGQIVILEFSKPANTIIGRLYKFYFTRILPGIGGKVSGERSAYSYLPDSVNSFPAGIEFLHFLKEEGFSDLGCKKLTFGIASVYSGFKKQINE
jgi:demethylmenaquinone methyltransferase / 2-methoxy-6-polyprenyl-1,4-benzoquinol methylase